MAPDSPKGFRCPQHWPLAQRLDYYIDRSGGADACWPWTGSLNTGYGQLNWKRKPDRAHRLMWMLHYGPIPPDKPIIMHRCDNRPCCNPAHLRTGTHADNAADRDAKGRGRGRGYPGERNGLAKLTDADVRAIRTAIGSQRAIARRFGVHQATVYGILRGKKWKHVT